LIDFDEMFVFLKGTARNFPLMYKSAVILVLASSHTLIFKNGEVTLQYQE
jgi:hypothetical protein